MADEITFDMDVDALIDALSKLGDDGHLYVNVASEQSAVSIVAEAKARLRRQLGPEATGKTVDSIQSRRAYDGNGYVVLTERDPFPELPVWLEKGTKKGKRPNRATTAPRPFFYISAELEEGPHFRRIQDAIQGAIDTQGLGR